MLQSYLTILEDIAAREFYNVADLVCKHFFNGAAHYSNRIICTSLTHTGIAFRPRRRCENLIVFGAARPTHLLILSDTNLSTLLKLPCPLC